MGIRHFSKTALIFIVLCPVLPLLFGVPTLSHEIRPAAFNCITVHKWEKLHSNRKEQMSDLEK